MKEISENYGSSEEDLTRVKAFATHYHLTTIKKLNASTSITLTGTVANMEAAFGVNLQYYQNETTKYRGRTGFSHSKRIRRSCRGCSGPRRSTPEACMWPEPLQSTDSAVVAGFLVEIKPLKSALIVLDTLARSAIGLDENSARDMGQFVAVCDWIKRSTGTCVLVVHHTDKSGTSERGSSALRGAADTLIKVTPEDSLRKISCEKMKDGPEFADRFIELVACENSLVVEPAESGQGRVTSTLTKTQREILRVLVLEAFIDSGASANRIIELSGSKPSATFSVLSSLKRKGLWSRIRRRPLETVTSRRVRPGVLTLATPCGLHLDSAGVGLSTPLYIYKAEWNSRDGVEEVVY